MLLNVGILYSFETISPVHIFHSRSLPLSMPLSSAHLHLGIHILRNHHAHSLASHLRLSKIWALSVLQIYFQLFLFTNALLQENWTHTSPEYLHMPTPVTHLHKSDTMDTALKTDVCMKQIVS